MPVNNENHIMTVKVTYLEMLARPERTVAPPRDDLLILHAKKPPVPYYRFLYDAVGAPWDWTSRKKKSDEELAEIIHHPAVELHVLHVEGVPAGFAELDGRVAGEVELTQFGLTQPFFGQGLGRYFLWWTIERAWSSNPKRFWLHTCTKDHPIALSNYQKAGFTIFKEEVKD